MTIDSEFIFSKISQEEIFERFLNIPIVPNKLFCSPLRDDKNPTCNLFYTSNNTLLLHDFSGHFSGNCFNLVKHLYSCNYNEALIIIAERFGIIDNNTQRIPKMPKHIIKTNSKTDIKVRWCKFNQQDLSYFLELNISIGILNKFEVGKCEFIWLNGSLIYTLNNDDPAYAYYFTNEEYKIYFPKRTNFRFLSNTNILQGFKQLPLQGDRLVITKSLKDIMTLYSYNIISVAPQGEAQIITKEQHEELSKRFKRIYILYDFDLTGIRSSNKMKKLYNYKPLFLTNGRFKTKNYKAKDISDYVKNRRRTP